MKHFMKSILLKIHDFENKKVKFVSIKSKTIGIVHKNNGQHYGYNGLTSSNILHNKASS